MKEGHAMSASKQKLKDKLNAIILLETAKNYKEMDSDLISECVDFLMELEGKQKLTDEEIRQRISEIPFKGKATAVGAYTKKKMRTVRIAVIAAVLAVILTLFGIITIASDGGFDQFLDRVGKTLMEMLEDGPVEHNNITIIKPNETKEYSSIEDLIKAEEIEMLYPAWLPDNEKIVTVLYTESTDKRYVLECSNPLYSISISINSSLSENQTEKWQKKDISGHSVYYNQYTGYIQSNFIYRNNLYSVKADTEDNLFRIIENLKEIE